MADDKRTKLGTGPVNTPYVPAASTPVPATSSQPSHVPQTVAGDPLLGQTLAGRYKIVRKLGEGGMGAVYLAVHNVLEKQVALKVLHVELARKPDLVERFMQEAKAASRIRHENVIDISDFGATPEGFVFFAMELLHGHDLHEEIARARLAGQLLPWSRSKAILLQVCAALAAAHAKGIVHRDLKPENVYLVEFLGAPDFVKLLDFGIAKLTEVAEGDRKLTRTGMLFGTPEYMSPEQARGEHVDHRVDIYAMGCILFQLVTGRVPFEAENFMGVLSLHLLEQPPRIPPEVFDRIGAPRALAGVIDRALAKDKHQRWQTIDELASAVRAISGDPPPVGASGHVPAQRAPSVPAPAATTERAAPAAPSGARQRTQWTGSLNVPQADAPAPARPRAKLPLVIGAVVLLGAGAIAGVALIDRGARSVAPGPGSGPGSSAVAGAAPPVAVAPPDAAPAPPPPLPAVPAQVTIRIDSQPRGAQLRDVATGRVLGPTPLTFRMAGSSEPRQFALTLKGHAEAFVTVVPDRDKIEHREKLERSTAATRRGSAAGAPEPPAGAGSAFKLPPVTTPAETDPVEPPEPADKDCGDPPCLKTVVPGLRAGSGSGG